MVVLLRNNKATFNYELIDTFTAGIKLEGHEVKALKTATGGSLVGAYIIIQAEKLILRGSMIPPYQAKNAPADYDALRDRELLVTKSERLRITRDVHEKGLTIVPLAMHNSHHRIVVECALVRGKKKHDKRDTIRKREDERKLRRELGV